MKNIAIIQARLGSKRFPRKVLANISGEFNTLSLLIARLRKSKKLYGIVVATTSLNEDKEIVKLCDKLNLDCYDRGNPNSALDTTIGAINWLKEKLHKKFNVADITADCPLICPDMLDQLLNDFLIFNLDYYSNCMIRSFPVGFDIQIYKHNMLIDVDEYVVNTNHRVHSGWNIWAYSDMLLEKNTYKFANHTAIESFFYPNWRLVVDYPEDLLLIKEILKAVGPYAGFEEITNYIKNNKYLLEINKNCKQKIAGLDK